MHAIVDLTDLQLSRLQKVAARDGISLSEAIRRAVDATYAEAAIVNVRAARAAAFGLWKDRKVDALRYVDRLRDDWEMTP